MPDQTDEFVIRTRTEGADRASGQLDSLGEAQDRVAESAGLLSRAFRVLTSPLTVLFLWVGRTTGAFGVFFNTLKGGAGPVAALSVGVRTMGVRLIAAGVAAAAAVVSLALLFKQLANVEAGFKAVRAAAKDFADDQQTDEQRRESLRASVVDVATRAGVRLETQQQVEQLTAGALPLIEQGFGVEQAIRDQLGLGGISDFAREQRGRLLGRGARRQAARATVAEGATEDRESLLIRAFSPFDLAGDVISGPFRERDLDLPSRQGALRQTLRDISPGGLQGDQEDRLLQAIFRFQASQEEFFDRFGRTLQEHFLARPDFTREQFGISPDIATEFGQAVRFFNLGAEQTSTRGSRVTSPRPQGEGT